MSRVIIDQCSCTYCSRTCVSAAPYAARGSPEFGALIPKKARGAKHQGTKLPGASASTWATRPSSASKACATAIIRPAASALPCS